MEKQIFLLNLISLPSEKIQERISKQSPRLSIPNLLGLTQISEEKTKDYYPENEISLLEDGKIG